jgi:hypothetical protein
MADALLSATPYVHGWMAVHGRVVMHERPGHEPGNVAVPVRRVIATRSADAQYPFGLL